MTTKYSSPRSTRIAKCPSTIRALSLSSVRQSRSFTGPQTETRARNAPAVGVGPGRAEVDGLLAILPQRDDDLPALARGAGFVAGATHEIAGSAGRRRGRPDRGPRRGQGRRCRPRRRQHRTQRQPAARAIPLRDVVRQRATSADDRDGGHRCSAPRRRIPTARRCWRTREPADSPLRGIISVSDLDRLEHLVEVGRSFFIVLSGPTMRM